MSFDQTKAFEVQNGIIVLDGAGVFSGAVSPVGFNAPEGSLYLRTSPYELWQKIGSGTSDWTLRNFANQASAGVTPPFTFSKAGACGQGTYLRTGEAVTSNTGQPIKGNNTIVEIAVTNAKNVTTNTTFQLRKRTAVGTFVDIAGAAVVILTGSYKASAAVSIAIGPDEEISAYNKIGTVSGPNVVTDPVLMVYPLPN